ncbi:MAG: iron transporter [Burkholderia sp.]|nr:iron transporter [Burkholderia sp.]
MLLNSLLINVFKLLTITSTLISFSVLAAEYPIGKLQVQGGMKIQVLYLQPITMDPEYIMRKASDSDIHLEADIHSVKNNPTGFLEGEWMPSLQVNYKLMKYGHKNWNTEGDLIGMVARDGPHYGSNVKLDGPGKYHLILIVKPPINSGHMVFGRHVDKETGVSQWFKPIKLEYDFPFAGIGKKGGY